MNIDFNSIKKIVTHDHCADGLSSAIICRRVWPGIKLEFCQYGTGAYESLAPEPGVLFVDFTPKPEHAKAWVDVGAYVLDHHEHAAETVAMFGERGLFDNDRCGALLAYDELYVPRLGKNIGVATFAALADIRDRWQTADPEWGIAQAQHRVLMAIDREVWLESDRFPSSAELEFGELMAIQERRNAERVVDGQLLERDVDGYRIGVCSANAALSSMIGEVGRERGYDMTACFFFTRDPDTGAKSIVYSLRSSERLDCGAFSKANKGGGHARASGFTVRGLCADPWELLITMFSGWLRERGQDDQP